MRIVLACAVPAGEWHRYLSHSFALVPQYVGYELNASASAFSKPQAARPEKLEAVNSSCDDYLGAGNACRRKRQCLKLLADRQ